MHAGSERAQMGKRNKPGELKWTFGVFLTPRDQLMEYEEPEDGAS